MCDARSAGLRIPVLAAVAVFTDVLSAAVLQGLPGLELDSTLVDEVVNAADPIEAGIEGAVAEAREALQIPGIDGVNLSGLASASGTRRGAEIKAEVGARIRAEHATWSESESAAAEFDTPAEWTAGVAKDLGYDFHIPAGCRGSGSPAVLDWLIEHLGIDQNETLLDCGAGVGGPAAYAAAQRDVRPGTVEPAGLRVSRGAHAVRISGDTRRRIGIALRRRHLRCGLGVGRAVHHPS